MFARRRLLLPLLLVVPALFALEAVDAGNVPQARHAAPAAQRRAALALRGELALAQQTAAVIAASTTPARDLLDLARRLRLHRVAPISPYVTTAPHDYQVGRIDPFFVAYADSGYFTMHAQLMLKTAHAYWYVDTRAKVDVAALARSAQAFEDHIYPTDRANFGTEWTPGIDGDPRITVLAGHVPGVGGYFSAEDLYPRLIAPYSNERKMIYFNTDNATPGTSLFNLILAHEFQHMIHWHMHPREDAWINEGSSELAQQINGFNADGDDQEFAQMPDTQLDAWSIGGQRDIAHYGASFLWMLYFYQHYGGQKALRMLLADRDKTGLALFDDVLRKVGSPDTANDMFRKWVVANYLNDPTLGDGSYGYTKWSIQAAVTPTLTAFPTAVTGSLAQYSTNYVALKPTTTAPLTVRFNGNATVPLLSAPTPRDGWLWWSNRGDVMNTTLTRAFDLRHVTAATLHYALWYDTEQNFDYGYIEVSADNGATWYSQRSAHTTTTNANGANYGNGYTGQSDSGTGVASGWLPETVSLTRYAGKRILVRFEYITDDSYNLQGIALGRVSIPEIGFAQDPSSAAGWAATGWVRVRNVLPESWLVQAIVRANGTTRVVEMPVVAGNGTLTLPMSAGATVVLAISPLAPQTTVPATYTLHVSP